MAIVTVENRFSRTIEKTDRGGSEDGEKKLEVIVVGSGEFFLSRDETPRAKKIALADQSVGPLLPAKKPSQAWRFWEVCVKRRF
jgi:hypothetical protein